MISRSLLPSPGGSAAFSFHAITRPELVNVPSSSAKHAVGRRNTSVLISAVFSLLNSPSSFPNSDVSVASGSMTTRNFRFSSAAATLARCETAASGLKPWQMNPFIWPWCMRSNMCSTS